MAAILPLVGRNSTAMEEAGDPPLSASRRKSSRKRSRPAEGKDLISALPDALIFHVFSFLDVEDVVKTSVLSKRWSRLWTHTPAISIDFWKVRGAFDQKFSFFDWFLMRCRPLGIPKFHLRSPYYPVAQKDRIDFWIRFAVGRRVEDLRIDVFPHVYVLPWRLLQCESLTSLWLSLCGFPYSSNGNLWTMSWKLLKVLSVHRSYMPDEVINVVLEGSPQLESLTLDTCYGMNSIRILSRTMRELVIRGYFVPHEYLREKYRRSQNLCLEIFVPYLWTLRLLNSWKGKEVIVLKEASSLVEVELNFSLTFRRNQDIIYTTMKGIFSELHCVDKLMVGNAALQVLLNFKGNRDFSLQLKCRHLTILNLSYKYSLGYVAAALECALNVEKLVIDFARRTHTGEISDFLLQGISQTKDPFSNKESLKAGRIRNIEITGFPTFSGAKKKNWLSLIKVLLQDARVLEKMVIKFWRYSARCVVEESHVQDVLEAILGYPRASKAAKVIMNYPFKRKASSVELT